MHPTADEEANDTALRHPASAVDTTVLPAEETTSAPPASDEPAQPGGRTGRLGTALKWSYLLTIGANTIVSLLTFVLAAILSPHEFGVLTMSMLWVAMALVLLQHGPTMAVMQQTDITDDHINAAFWSTVAGGAGYSLLFAAVAPLWAALNGVPEMTAVCLALAPIPLIQALNVIPDALQRRRMQIRGIAIRMLVANLVGGLGAVGCALAGMGVWSLVVQQLAWPTLYALMLWPTFDWRPRFAPIRGPLRDLRRVSLQTYAGAIGNFLAARTDQLLMGLFFGPVVIGLYRFAARFIEMVISSTAGGLHVVSLPHLARQSEDRSAFARELGRLMHGAAVLAFPALGIVAGVAQPLVLFIGPQWAEAAHPLRLLCLVGALSVIGTMLQMSLQAAQRAGIPALFTWISMGAAALAIYLSARVSADDGTVGRLMAVAWAMLAVQVATVAAMGYVFFRRVMRISARPIVAGSFSGTASGILAVVAGTLTYSLLGAALNTFLSLLVSGVASATAAGLLLLALDGEVRSRLAAVGSRFRRTVPAQA